MNCLSGLSENSKVQLLAVAIPVLAGAMGFVIKNTFYPGATPVPEQALKPATAHEQIISAANSGVVGGSAIHGGVHSGGANNRVEFVGDDQVTHGNSTKDSNNVVHDYRNNRGTVTVNANTDNSVTTHNNSTHIGYIVNNVPTEAQRKAAAKGRQRAAHLEKKRDIFRQVSKQFHSVTFFTVDPDSLFAALENYSQSKALLSDIELYFSSATSQQAQAFFTNARSTIACAYGERNQPRSCERDNAQHPENRYEVLFAKLKGKMAAEINSPL